jgi:hypothetical protein
MAKINPSSFLDLITGGKPIDVYADKYVFFNHLLDVSHLGTEDYFDFLICEINKYVNKHKNVSEKVLLKEFKKSKIEPLFIYGTETKTTSTPAITRLLFWPLMNANIQSKTYKDFNINLDLLHQTFLPQIAFDPMEQPEPQLLILIDFKFNRNKLSELICLSPAGTINVYDNKMNLKKIIFEDKSEISMDTQ